MSDTTFVLKFYGYLMILVGFAMLFSKNAREELIKESSKNIILFGFINLLIGLPIIIIHNKWGGPWEIVVSLMGWLSTIKGFVRILNLPQLNKVREDKTSESMLKKYSYVIILLGCVFIYGAL